MSKFELLEDLKKWIENDLDLKVIKGEVSKIENQI